MNEILETSLKQVRWIAILSRVGVLVLQVITNTLIPDHNADAFRKPFLNKDVKFLDAVVNILFGGLSHWDGQYFLHVAEYGYTYENTLAFFPMYPVLMRFVASILPIQRILDTQSLLLFSGVMINLVLFIYTAELIYKLSVLVLKDERLAIQSAYLFCVNPASIFFTACYSESVYFFLTVWGLVQLETDHVVQGSFLFGISTLTRSNGLINSGFILWNRVVYRFWAYTAVKKRVTTAYFLDVLGASLACALAVMPFGLYQIYAFILYCVPNPGLQRFAHEVEAYGGQQDFVMPSRYTQPPWCNFTPPLSYNYIQDAYWDVGFLRYYQLKKFPNFILAMPIVTLVTLYVYKYYKANNHYLRIKLQQIPDILRGKHFKSTAGVFSIKCFPYLVHATFLIIYGLLFIHVEVLTRLLCSSSPVVYWMAAWLIKQKKVKKQAGTAYQQGLSVWYQLDWVSRVVILYFLSYFVIGISLHSNYLPWT